MKHHVQIGQRHLQIEKKDQQYVVENNQLEPIVLSKSKDEVSYVLGNKLFQIRKIKNLEDNSAQLVSVNGKVFTIQMKSDLELLIEKMGGGTGGQNSAKTIKAPMPGLIVQIKAEEGQAVSKGDVLLNFEAMKMENQLKSPGSGTVKRILVQKGDKIDKGQILVELE